MAKLYSLFVQCQEILFYRFRQTHRQMLLA